jgi:predicted DsbA family dithiol-disulfide isomerase
VGIERLQSRWKIDVRWSAFPLHPDTPKEGLTLEELFAGRPVNIQEMKARLQRVAHDLGLPWGERRKTFNSRLAQELGKWAETKGVGDAFHLTVFKAYFVAGKNIAVDSELTAIAETVGLSRQQAQDVLESRSFRDAVDSDWQRARQLGVTAVPTFVVNGDFLVGAQPFEALESFVLSHR